MTNAATAAALEAAHKLYETDQASQALGIRITDVSPGVATVTMTVREDMVNGHGICHGGFIFMLADSGFAFACNSRGPATVAAGAAIEFLAPARIGEELTAVAREHWLGGKTGLYDVVVSRADGTIIACFRGRSHRLSRAPEPIP